MQQVIQPADITRSVKEIPPDLWILLEDLPTILRRHYGCDYAFTICAEGHIIAASNMVNGIILPRQSGDKRLP